MTGVAAPMTLRHDDGRPRSYSGASVEARRGGDLMPGKAAWTAILHALPAHWRVDDPMFDPGRRIWRAMAMSERPGRAQPPETVSGTGASALAALSDLEVRLRGAPHPDGSCVDELRNVRLLVPGSGTSESPPDRP